MLNIIHAVSSLNIIDGAYIEQSSSDYTRMFSTQVDTAEYSQTRDNPRSGSSTLLRVVSDGIRRYLLSGEVSSAVRLISIDSSMYVVHYFTNLARTMFSSPIIL